MYEGILSNEKRLNILYPELTQSFTCICIAGIKGIGGYIYCVWSCVVLIVFSLSLQLCVAGVGYLELMLAVRTPLTEEEFEASNKGQVAQLLKEGEECRGEGRGGESGECDRGGIVSVLFKDAHCSCDIS